MRCAAARSDTRRAGVALQGLHGRLRNRLRRTGRLMSSLCMAPTRRHGRPRPRREDAAALSAALTEHDSSACFASSRVRGTVQPTLAGSLSARLKSAAAQQARDVVRRAAFVSRLHREGNTWLWPRVARPFPAAAGTARAILLVQVAPGNAPACASFVFGRVAPGCGPCRTARVRIARASYGAAALSAAATALWAARRLLRHAVGDRKRPAAALFHGRDRKAAGSGWQAQG